jgi:hypothetical protein
MSQIGLTVIAVITVAVLPLLAGLATGMRRGGGLVLASIAAAIIALFWAIYWAALANPHHVKHTVLFAALAVVALIGASFSRPVRVV